MIFFVSTIPLILRPSQYDLNLYINASGLTQVLSVFTKLCALILTIPVTSAAAKRSFAAPHRIHSYRRNTNIEESKCKVVLTLMDGKDFTTKL